MKNMNNARYLLGALAAAAIAVALGGCAAAVVGGAVAGGMVATDRRSTGAQVDDQNIELRASSSLSGTFGERAHINVTSYNAQVLITGEVLTEQDKQQAQQIVGKVPDQAGGVPARAAQGLDLGVELVDQRRHRHLCPIAAGLVEHQAEVLAHPVDRKAEVELVLDHGLAAVVHLPALRCALADDVEHQRHVQPRRWPKASASARPCTRPGDGRSG
jgi:citrate lyase gamma subunit